eukprot:CAMPEP_0194146740 /NCGR_PEP_ID=MMETSP0152-20130528/21539_1 /TAXON_ID=1049557 /ORGANISM="Thalassiothrix antarctica, Strain L6-D1" /LENGTH=502 /DNA_ID=CAMNT_0038847331 /DNA_START=22 /DNA_END=1530 /DNA_ORIENTATION=+
MRSSTLVCALSGQSIPSNEEAVVTPSGKICLKGLLLSKLADNGGTDPFSEEPMDEERLVSLSSSSLAVIPPRPSATSLPELLNLLNTEYSNLVLELFDTRRLLEETRKELSQALYQNDASVRVVARLSQERDAARQELANWNVQSLTQDTNNEGASRKRTRLLSVNDSSEQSVEVNSIPTSHLEIMTETWKALSQKRKAQKKEVGARAPSQADVKAYVEMSHTAYHKAYGKQGIMDIIIIAEENLVVSVGKDRQVCLFDGGKVVQSYGTGDLIPCFVDAIGTDLIAVASLCEVSLIMGEKRLQLKLETFRPGEKIVDLSLHPSNQHVIVATTNRINIYSTVDGNLLAYFNFCDNITCGALHPDGLIYAVGTDGGKMALWDLKSQKLASTLGDGGMVMQRIVFSNNGYHVASLAGKLNVWDLKKQVSIIELGIETDELQSMIFDPSGKYLAYGGGNGVSICAVKEWTELVKLDFAVSQLDWGGSLVSSSLTERTVRFYGLKVG